jgi:hypothetical protein
MLLMESGTIIESVRDAIAVASGIIESAEQEVAWLVPAPLLVIAARYNLNEKSKVLMQRGGRIRGITSISPPYLNAVRELVHIGEEVRNVQDYSGEFMLVGDRNQSISSMSVVAEDIALDSKIVAFWTDNPDYAEYLLSIFETVWQEATGARKVLSEF